MVRRLSVVIANHDYERFVGRAVDSALAITWSDVEVIVVDDGSTDGSLAVLRAYGDRIVLIESENRGQREAINRGYAVATGDAVVFLDSDDVLPSDLATRAARLLVPGVSKVQFSMQRIDEHDQPIGVRFPVFRRPPRPAQIRRWMLATTAYPTPPGSGNLYPRSFLSRVMPQGPEIGAFSDSGLLAAAPLLGDVVTVPDVVVGYRRHGANDSDLVKSPHLFIRECRRALDRWNHARDVAGLPPDPRRVFRSREVLQFRAVAARLTPSERLPGDGPLLIALHALRSPVLPGPEPMMKRLAIAAWSFAVIVAPRTAHRRLIARRYTGAR